MLTKERGLIKISSWTDLDFAQNFYNFNDEI